MRGPSSGSHPARARTAHHGGVPPLLVEQPGPPELLGSWPASLQLLLGPPAAELWTAVLAARGGRLLRLRPTGAGLQPDGAATVQYAAEVVWTHRRTTSEVLAATTGSRIPDGAAVLEGTAPDGGAVTVGVWRWPLDPALPGLAWAARAAQARERLAALGLGGGLERVRLRAYRPGRRAVVEAVTPDGPLFLKVVPPGAVGRLVERHAALAGAVPAPPVLAATDDGVVVLPGLAGTPMRGLLLGRDPGSLPGPRSLDRLLDALPPAVADLRRRGRRAPGDALARAADHAAVIGAVLPALGDRLGALTAALADADPGAHPDIPVHGDFYESQLLVDQGAVVGLLDVDTAGRGHRVDDWATLLGHLALLEHMAPGSPVAGYRAAVEEHVLGRWPADQVRPRVAAVLVGLATGPFRVQQAGWPARTETRVALAERWAAPAGR